MLFQTKQEAQDYAETQQLRDWIHQKFNWAVINRYTLAQLRAVKRILEWEGEPEKRIYAKTTMKAMPGSCTECRLGERYGCVGDVKCRILKKYFTGNVEPPYKERPDECPLLEIPSEFPGQCTSIVERDSLRAEMEKAP